MRQRDGRAEITYKPASDARTHRRDGVIAKRETNVALSGADRAEVLRVAALLGCTGNQLTGENTTKIYTRYGIDLTAITDLRFNPQDE